MKESYMNKLGYFIVILGSILLIALAVFVIMAIGTKVDVNLEGVQFRAGLENIEYEGNINVTRAGNKNSQVRDIRYLKKKKLSLQ